MAKHGIKDIISLYLLDTKKQYIILNGIVRHIEDKNFFDKLKSIPENELIFKKTSRGNNVLIHKDIYYGCETVYLYNIVIEVFKDLKHQTLLFSMEITDIDGYGKGVNVVTGLNFDNNSTINNIDNRYCRVSFKDDGKKVYRCPIVRCNKEETK